MYAPTLSYSCKDQISNLSQGEIWFLLFEEFGFIFKKRKKILLMFQIVTDN